MVKKGSDNIYLIRLYRESGELQELFLQAQDVEMALYNAEKSFNREFKVLDVEKDIPVLEEVKND